MDYSYAKVTDYSFDEARERIEAELDKEGFGVLTEIDVQATMKKKLDVDFPKYVILGACNPPFAHKALTREQQVGLLMPCNVIVFENEEGKTVISAMNVEVAMGSVVPSLNDLAAEVGARLQAAVDRA